MVTRIIINSFEDDSDQSRGLIKVRRSYECDNLKVAVICMNVYQEITNIYIEQWSDENGNILPEVEENFQITRTINNIEKMIEKSISREDATMLKLLEDDSIRSIVEKSV